MTTVYKFCVGPALRPDKEKCLTKNSIHQIDINNKNVLPYTGIINWRCAICFTEHRKRLKNKII